MNTKISSKIPPDGGWGWIIVVGYAINGLSTIPIMQGFGLIFKDTFPLLGFSATDSTVIINTNLAFGMVLGLLNGPLLRRFGYRKIAVVGTLVYTLGVTLTAFANKFYVIMVSYGILASLGLGLTMSSFSFALNSFFTTKRGRAMGLALTITGLGPILIPQLTAFLITFYGFQGTILLYGAITLHSLIGATLLRPVKWYMKEAPITSKNAENAGEKMLTGKEEKTTNMEGGGTSMDSLQELSNLSRKRKMTITSIDHDVEVGSIYGFETPLPRQLSETLQSTSWDRNLDIFKTTGNIGSSKTNLKCPRFRDQTWWSSAKSIDTINLGSSIKIFDEEYSNDKTLKKYPSVYSILSKDRRYEPVLENGALLEKESERAATNANDDSTEKPIGKSILMRLVDFYDLGLLRDPIYVNIMMGMAIAIFAEINFSLLTPFILAEMGLPTAKIATVMSVIATVDLVSRSMAPFLGEWLRFSARTMYLLSLMLLMVSRATLTFANGFTSTLFIAVGLGAAKGIRSVYMTLVVPSYVPIDRLPYASGIQMIINGIVLMGFGPLVGILRDATGSYLPCIFMLNCVTAVTITLWILEICIVRRIKSRKQVQQEADDSILQEA